MSQNETAGHQPAGETLAISATSWANRFGALLRRLFWAILTISMLTFAGTTSALATCVDPSSIAVPATGTADFTIDSTGCGDYNPVYLYIEGGTGTLRAGNSSNVTFASGNVYTITAVTDTSFKISILSRTSNVTSDSVAADLWDGISSSTRIAIVVALPLFQPIVTSISPSNGPEGGFTQVTINGSNFTTDPSHFTVAIGGVAVSSGRLISATTTQIVFKTPPGTGTQDITVTTDGGTSTTSAADQFTYLPPAPTLTSISPTSGSTTGGTSVTITGTNFATTPGDNTVDFGTVAATVTAASATSLTVTAPAGTGTQDVTVTTAGGTTSITAADQFTYIAPPAPTVTSISPTSGPEAGGTTVTITGTDFDPIEGNNTVKFGTTVAAVTGASSTSLTVTAPAGTSTADVTVTTNSGTSPISAADEFTYLPSPTVTSVASNTGPETGGSTVFIYGTHFDPVAGNNTVKFGAITVGVTFANSTGLVVVSPPGTGTVDIVVTTANGTSAITAADQYTYVPSPTVTSISPTSGPEAGGTTVTISGSNFDPTPDNNTVTFGTTQATVTGGSSSSLTVTAPAGTGTVDVTVVAIGGTSATSAADRFTYIAPVAPAITAISPTSGPAAGNTTVTITGTDFDPTAGNNTVKFGAAVATVTGATATSLTVTAPAGTSTADITVTTNTGTSATSAADQFTYLPAPAITAISPASGPEAGGTTVTITGSGFATTAADNTVTFGAVNATVVSGTSTSLTVTAPAGIGVVDVTVNTSNGTSATSTADQFTYSATPAIATLNPNSGPEAGGTTVTITGANFDPTATNNTVKFGSTATTVTGGTTTWLTVTAPAGTGTVDVTIANTGGTSAIVAADKFAYDPPVPAISSISPTSGPEAGGTTVTISGTGFSPTYGDNTVKFGGTAATVTGGTATSLTVTTPPGTGTVDVTVNTTGGTSPTSASDRFTYIVPAPVPTVSSISPGAGPETGGTAVVITGMGFDATPGNNTVKFGGTAASVTAASSTSLTVTAPAGIGTQDITVTTAGGTSTTSAADRFAYKGFADAAKDIRDFLDTRGSLILANQPDMQRRIDRLNSMDDDGSVTPAGAPAGGPAASGGGADGSASASASPIAGLMNYLPEVAAGTIGVQHVSTSLAAINAMEGNHQQSRFDAWVDSTFGVYSDTDRQGEFGLVSVGADYLVNRNLLIGGFVQADIFPAATGSNGSAMGGTGWLAGPYATLRLADHLYLDVLAAAGTSSNTISPDGSYTDSFGATRWMASGTLSGQWQAGGWTFGPEARLSYYSETSDAYLDHFGVNIPSVTAGQGQVALGPNVSYRLDAGGGVVIDTSVRLDGLMNIATDSGSTSIEDIRGRAETGVNLTLPGGFSLGVSAAYDGIGSSTTSATTGSLNLKAPLF